MGLNHTDDTDVTTSRTTKMRLYLFDFHLETCTLLLQEACAATKEALHKQALKENLQSLQHTTYRLENSEPDQILVREYQDKKNDIFFNIAQRMKEINKNLAIFEQDPISIIRATFASVNLDLSSLLHDTIRFQSSKKRPTVNHTEAVPSDTFPKIAPSNGDITLPAPPDVPNTTDNNYAVIMPATDIGVPQTAVYPSHELHICYGL